MTTEPLIRNISDTALWVAMYRAWETEQPNPVFRDPYARRLAGKRGEEIMANIKVAHRHAWSYTARTHNIDSFVKQEVDNGADMVVDLAAGLDTRPYRMQLPSSLQWIEIDLPELLTYKDQVLRGEKPVCRLERIPIDLANAGARRVLFEELGRAAKRAVIISEGLIVYLTADEVCSLARDLAAPASFQRWATDLVSPGLLTSSAVADAPLCPFSRHPGNEAEADLGRGRAVGEEIRCGQASGCLPSKPLLITIPRRNNSRWIASSTSLDLSPCATT